MLWSTRGDGSGIRARVIRGVARAGWADDRRPTSVEVSRPWSRRRHRSTACLTRGSSCRQAPMRRGCRSGRRPRRARTEREAGATQRRRRLLTSERQCAREYRTFRLNGAQRGPSSQDPVEGHGRGTGERSRAAPGCPAGGRCLTSAVSPPVNGSIGFSRGKSRHAGTLEMPLNGPYAPHTTSSMRPSSATAERTAEGPSRAPSFVRLLR